MADDWEDVADNWEDEGKNWDGEDNDEPTRNWDDEDQEEDDPFGAVKVVKDSPKKATPAVTTPTKKKIAPKKKLSKKALQNKLKVVVDPNEEKLRLLKLQRDSDLETASDLLSTNTKTSLSDFKPTTELEFLKLSSMVVDELNVHEESPHYPEFVKDLTRKLAGSLTAEQITSIISGLNVVVNSKRDEERGKKRKPTAAKKVIDEEFVEEDFIEDDYSYGFLS